MPVRDMGYEYASYEEQIRKIKAENRRNGLHYFTREIGDHQKLTPVIPIVLYFGREPWSAPLSLFDLLNIPEERKQWVEPLIQNHYIRLIHLAAQDESTRNKYHSDFRHIVNYLSCRNDKKAFETFLKKDNGRILHPEALLDVMGALTKNKQYQTLKANIKNYAEKGGEITMCMLVDMLEERGMEKGIDAINLLVKRLIADGRTDDLLRSTQNPEFQKALMQEYGIR